MLEKIYKKILEIILKIPKDTVKQYAGESPELAILSILITIPFASTPIGAVLGKRAWLPTFLFLKILKHVIIKIHKKFKDSDTDKIIEDINNSKLTEEDYIKLQNTLKDYKEKLKNE